MTMELTLLGTGHAVVTEYYNTCFVLRENGRSFLVDGGGGSGLLVQLKRAGIDWRSIEAMFVTHRHTDHILGIVWMMRLIAADLRRNGHNRAVTIYANDEVVTILMSLAQLLLAEEVLPCIEQGLNLRVVADGDTHDIIGHTVQFFDINSTKAAQMGFTLDLGAGESLACCGDEPFNEVCKPYVEKSTWLLHEAFCLDSQAEVFKPYEKHHSTAKDAAETAQRLCVENLVLYHTEDRTVGKRKELYTNEAKRYFDGCVYVPDDLEVIDLTGARRH